MTINNQTKSTLIVIGIILFGVITTFKISQNPNSKIEGQNSFKKDVEITNEYKPTIDETNESVEENLSINFPDVPDDHYAKKYIIELASRSIVSGYENGNFGPDDYITDLQLLSIIFAASGENIEKIPEGSTWQDQVIWKGQEKFLQDVDEPWISVNDQSVRGEVIAYALMGKNIEFKYINENSYFTDVPPDYIWKDYIDEAYQRGIIEGLGRKKFKPNDQITRGQVAKIVYNVFFENEETLRNKFLNNKETRIMFGGDVMLARTVGTKIDANGVNYPFEQIKNLLETPNFTYVNLETSVSNGGQRVPKGIEFRAKPEALDGVKWAGIDQVCLANNHTGDYGDEALLDTFTHLTERGIDYVGAGYNAADAYEYKLQEIDGIKVAFLCYNGIDPRMFEATEDSPGSAWIDEIKMRENITLAKENAELVFVSLHQGTEYTPHPTSYQINSAQIAIDSGADAVISHHPHVVQAIQIYNGKPILYSLGNLVFDQMWSIPTQQGLLADISIKNKELQYIDLIPVHIYDYAQPKLSDENEKNQILQRIYDASLKFGQYPEIKEGYIEL